MKKVVTHNGRFHADDVFAVAILAIYFNDEIEIIRTRDESTISLADIVLDVGRVYDPSKQKFDHHQDTFTEKRPNNIPYSAVGLIWKEYGDKITGNETLTNRLDKILFEKIDAEDNGIDFVHPDHLIYQPYTIQDVISSFVPSFKNKNDVAEYEGFIKAVEFAKQLINQVVNKLKDNIEGENLAREVIEKQKDNQYIIIENRIPWSSVILDYQKPLFIVEFNPNNNEWRITAIRKSEKSLFDVRKNLPQSWGGKEGSDLEKVTGVKGAKFCHKGLFLAIASDKESAIKLVELAL